MEAKKIAKCFNIDNKMYITAKRQCFVTIRDHKDNFRVNPKYIDSLIPQKLNQAKEVSIFYNKSARIVEQH